jgi:hypothetical protein
MPGEGAAGAACGAAFAFVRGAQPHKLHYIFTTAKKMEIQEIKQKTRKVLYYRVEVVGDTGIEPVTPAV